MPGQQHAVRAAQLALLIQGTVVLLVAAAGTAVPVGHNAMPDSSHFWVFQTSAAVKCEQPWKRRDFGFMVIVSPATFRWSSMAVIPLVLAVL